MRYEVRLPSLGEDSDELATVSFWPVKEGDTVNEDDDLVEMTTDKAAFIVPCPKTGVLVERRVGEGNEVAVGDVICVLEV